MTPANPRRDAEPVDRAAAPARSIAVYGAGGHTARFVIAELRRRGWTPIPSARDVTRLDTRHKAYEGLDIHTATVDDPASLDRVLSGAAAVINCAGPFLDTAAPVIEAALRARIPYLDLAAEQEAVRTTFERYDAPACTAGVAVVPAMAFYGGLADLLATAAMGDWTEADSVEIAVALDSWQPTRGTRLTGARNTFPRVVYADHRLVLAPSPPQVRTWSFPAPFGACEVSSLPLSEIVILSRHLPVATVHSYMNAEPLRDLRDPSTVPPAPADDSGRSAQVFMVDVVVRRGREERRATAHGRDIYAVSAPLVVEAMTRIVGNATPPTGVHAPGTLFDARDFLAALSPQHLEVTIG